MSDERLRADRMGLTALCKPALKELARNPVQYSVTFVVETHLGIVHLSIVKLPTGERTVGYTWAGDISPAVAEGQGLEIPISDDTFPTPGHALQDALLTLRKRVNAA